MAEPIYYQHARMWLANHIHEQRKEQLLLVAAYLLCAAVLTCLGLYVLGWYAGLGGLLILLVGYLACGGFRSEEPVINAQTIRPRLNGVPRSQMRLAWWGPEQTRRELSFVIGMLTAPIHLPVEAWRTWKIRKQLAHIDEDDTAIVLAAIAEQNGAVLVDDLEQMFGAEKTAEVLGALQILSPAIWLHAPARVSLTDEARAAIRNA